MANVLKTNYKDDILNVSENALRKFNMIQNEDGTVSFEDVTVYEQVGDSFGAGDINATNEAINNSIPIVKIGGSDTILAEAYEVIKDKWSEIPNGSSFLEMGYGTSFAFGYKFGEEEGYFLGISQNTRTPYKVTLKDGIWKYITFTMGTELDF